MKKKKSSRWKCLSFDKNLIANSCKRWKKRKASQSSECVTGRRCNQSCRVHDKVVCFLSGRRCAGDEWTRVRGAKRQHQQPAHLKCIGHNGTCAHTQTHSRHFLHDRGCPACRINGSKWRRCTTMSLPAFGSRRKLVGQISKCIHTRARCCPACNNIVCMLPLACIMLIKNQEVNNTNCADGTRLICIDPILCTCKKIPTLTHTHNSIMRITHVQIKSFKWMTPQSGDYDGDREQNSQQMAESERGDTCCVTHHKNAAWLK